VIVVKRGNRRYRLKGRRDGHIVLEDRGPGNRDEALVAHRRFRDELERGATRVLRPCDHCGLPVDRASSTSCRACRMDRAAVAERCEVYASEPGWPRRMAREALRSGDPEEHLLGVVGDFKRSHYERDTATTILSGAVPAAKLIEAEAECPACGNGEQFRIDPDTGAAECHCGEEVAPADD
jgi:hypothetical protein